MVEVKRGGGGRSGDEHSGDVDKPRGGSSYANSNNEAAQLFASSRQICCRFVDWNDLRLKAVATRLEMFALFAQ